jgi:hypothetical protein
MHNHMTNSDKFTWTILAYIASLFVVGPLTFLSWLVAFAHSEGTIAESVGILGSYAFLIFRFPVHNLLDWLSIEDDYFFSGLILNIFINSALVTWVVITVMTRKGKFKVFE